MVKFEEELVVKAKKEWRANYIQYSKLKRIIEKIEISLEDEEFVQARRQSSAHITRDITARKRMSVVSFNVDGGADHSSHSHQRKMSKDTKASHLKRPSATFELLQPRNVCPKKREEFFSCLQSNLDTINDFFMELMGGLEEEMEKAIPSSSGSEDGLIANDDEKIASQDALVELYMRSKDLSVFSELNSTGVRKIVKKYDKTCCEHNLAEWTEKLKTCEFYNQAFRLKEFRNQIENHLKTMSFSDGSISQTLEKLKSHTKKNHVETNYIWKPYWILFGLIVSVAVYFIPFYDDYPRAHRCAVLLVFTTIAWVMESMPFFVTALNIPLLAILLQVLQPTQFDLKIHDSCSSTGEVIYPSVSYDAEAAANLAFSHIFDNTLALVLGGFAISAAFTKYKFQLQIVLVIQRYFENSPRLFILAFMSLGAFLSMWISNVAGSVLVTSLLLPIIRDLPSDGRFTKTSIIAVAFACNVGGMLSPIASPQNAVATGILSQNGHSVSFFQWLEVAVPFGIVAIGLIWSYFMLFGKPNDIDTVPEVVVPRYKMTKTHWAVLFVSFATIMLWCTLQATEGYLGNQGLVALFPIIIFFGTGILSKNDWNNFSWNLVFLIGGGNVLGLCISNSQLLQLIVDDIEPTLKSFSFFELAIVMSALIIFITTFVSHTVASLILMPVLESLGESLGCTEKLVMIGALATSASMALPMSGFPNMNALLLENDLGRQYLGVWDFVKNGAVCSFMLFILNSTLGYGLVTVVFG
eukprot:Nk52_evm123s151 gene=Nk52_evmTU123s151